MCIGKGRWVEGGIDGEREEEEGGQSGGRVGGRMDGWVAEAWEGGMEKLRQGKA